MKCARKVCLEHFTRQNRIICSKYDIQSIHIYTFIDSKLVLVTFRGEENKIKQADRFFFLELIRLEFESLESSILRLWQCVADGGKCEFGRHEGMTYLAIS